VRPWTRNVGLHCPWHAILIGPEGGAPDRAVMTTPARLKSRPPVPWGAVFVWFLILGKVARGRWSDFASDAEYFLDNALYNSFLWRSQELRDILNKLCWDHPDPNSRLDMPNAYNSAEVRMFKQHPEWFKSDQ